MPSMSMSVTLLLVHARPGGWVLVMPSGNEIVRAVLGVGGVLGGLFGEAVPDIWRPAIYWLGKAIACVPVGPPVARRGRMRQILRLPFRLGRQTSSCFLRDSPRLHAHKSGISTLGCFFLLPLRVLFPTCARLPLSLLQPNGSLRLLWTKKPSIQRQWYGRPSRHGRYGPLSVRRSWTRGRGESGGSIGGGAVMRLAARHGSRAVGLRG